MELVCKLASERYSIAKMIGSQSEVKKAERVGLEIEMMSSSSPMKIKVKM